MTETAFDCEHGSALQVLDEHVGPVVVDFDETLFLANSTTLFIASARPAVLAYLIVKVLDVFRPWRWTGGSVTRDAWRVKALLTLMPWTAERWRRAAPDLANRFANEPLVNRVRAADGSVVVSTLGFTPVVEPLLDALSLGPHHLVAMEPSPEGRRVGKLEPTVQAVGAEEMDYALVVTDSSDDLPLLERAGKPLRVVWPDAVQLEPFPTIYYPTRYLHVVKRPGSRYRRQIFKEDFALWLLASIWLAENPLTHALGLALLALSFWSVYEFGYIDNDRTGERFEDDPRLSEAYRQRILDPSWWSVGAWAVGAAVAGLWVLRFPSGPGGVDFLRWAAVLVATSGIFWFYNRIDKPTRVLVFPLLQLLRLGAFVALVPTTTIADLAIALTVMVRAFNYYLYRTRSDAGWPDDDLSSVRLIVFAAATALLAAQGLLPVGDAKSVLTAPATLTALTLLGWQVFLARHNLPAAVRRAHRIDR